MEKVIILFKLLPAIIAAIKAIEEAIPGQGQGEQKLAAIRGMLEVVFERTNEFWPDIVKLIGVTVGLFNRVGWK